MSDALKSRNRCYDFKNIFAEKIGAFYFYFIHKKLLISLVLKKNANFVAENWVKSLKIVIITSTPGNCENTIPQFFSPFPLLSFSAKPFSFWCSLFQCQNHRIQFNASLDCSSRDSIFCIFTASKK
jgi:hypothetical protein